MQIETELSHVKTKYVESTQTENIPLPLSSVFGPFHGCTIGTINVNLAPQTMKETTSEQLHKTAV